MVKALTDTYTTFKTIFTGMGITMRHLFRKSVTIQYPVQRDVLPERVRLKLHVNIDDCIGCRLCERACPVECIEIGTIKSTDNDDLGETSTGHKKKLWVDQFDIDMAKCCYCELCVHPCPTDCITMVEDYEYSVYDRKNLVFSFSDMTPEQTDQAKTKLEQEGVEKQKKKEAALLAKQKKAEDKAGGKEGGETTGMDAKGMDAKGMDAKGMDAKGMDAKGMDAKGMDASGMDASGMDAKGDDDTEKEARRAEREARRAARKAEREAKKEAGE